MSNLILTKTAAPSTPSSTKSVLFIDTNDQRPKVLDNFGVTHVLDDNAAQSGRNHIVNGNFAISQRLGLPYALANVAGASTTVRVYTVADRWGHTVGNATTPQSAIIDTAGAAVTGLSTRFYLQLKQLTNAAKMCLSQPIESVLGGATLRGKTVSLQAKLWLSGAFTPVVRLGLLSFTGTTDADTRTAFISAFNGAGVDPTFGTNLALITPVAAQVKSAAGVISAGVIAGNAVSCTITANVQTFSAVFNIPTGANNVIPVLYTDNTMAVGDILCVSEVGLYVTQNILDWVDPDPAAEVAKCQRYYVKTFKLATAPAQNATINSGELKFPAQQAAATVSGLLWQFPVEMKAAPTVTFYNPAAANAQVRDEVAAGDCSSTGLQTNVTTDVHSCAFKTTGNASTAIGNTLGVHIATTTDAEF